ncbi:MAG TPA: hypothetical protein VFX59_04475 [Polyangiales bacterium]|nr:hypothetical protein [Polyangiales bacterium]
MPLSNVELACEGCGITAVVKASVLNSHGVIARPAGWTHGGHGTAVIGAKDYCPDCSPQAGGTPWNEPSPSVPPAGVLAVLVLD